MWAPKLPSLVLRLALAVVALMATSAAVHAQAASGGGYAARARQASARPITFARGVEGRLSASDPTFSDNSHFQVWKFAAQSGQDVVIALSSREFGAFLMLVAASGETDQPLRMAIADTATRTAQVTVRIPADGEYLIVANTQEARATGRYQVSVRSVADACAAGGPCSIGGPAGGVTPISRMSLTSAPSLALGASVAGELTRSNPQLADSSRYNAWRFDGRAGQRIVIDQTSSEFDTYLLLVRPTPTGPALFRENDDAPISAAGVTTENSQIAVELPETGPYLILATSFRPDVVGRYQLTLRPMDEACAAGGPCTPTAAPARRTFFSNVLAAPSPNILLGDSALARVDSRDRSLGDGTRFESYVFRGNANDEIAIFLEARAPDATRFDPYLHLLRQVGDTLAAVKSDDDGGGQRNSLITARLPVSGEYFIVANGLSVADTGNFALTVMRLADACRTRRVCAVGATVQLATAAEAVRAAPADPIALGQTVTGSFDAGTAKLPDGKPFAALRYTARAGERVVITNRSDAFDAYLYLFALRGDSVVELASDDDGAGGLNAQIAFQFATAGDYLIVPGSFDAAARGEYQVTLEAMAVACAAGGPCAPGETSALTARLLPALDVEYRDLPARGVVRAELLATAPRLEFGRRFQSFRFRGRAGERIVISFESAAFDAHLQLAQIRGGRSLRFVGRDDDGGAGTNARLVATLPEGGDYLVVASSFQSTDSTGFGSYVISRASCDSACAAYEDLPGSRTVEVYAPVLRAERRRIPASGEVSGTLAAADSMLTDSTRFHAYWIQASRGRTLRAALHSSDFDPFAVLMRVERNTLTIVSADDDDGEGTDALLEWVVDRPGTYVLVVTAYAQEALGRYVLNVEQGTASGGDAFRAMAADAALRPLLEAAFAASSQPLTAGREVAAQFAVGAPRLPGRGRFQSYRFTGRANERIAVTATSDEIDTYLYLAQVIGGSARLIGMDDDGGGGTNSRISVNLPADGEYLVVVAEFVRQETPSTAAYSVRLEVGTAASPVSQDAQDAYVLPVSFHTPRVLYEHGAQAVLSSLTRSPRPRRLR